MQNVGYKVMFQKGLQWSGYLHEVTDRITG